MQICKLLQHKKILYAFFLCLCCLTSSLFAQNKSRKKKEQKHIEIPEELRNQNGGVKAIMQTDKGQTPVKITPKKDLTRILFIFDDSQSMLGYWQSGPKIDVAKKLMGELLDSLKKNSDLLQVGLRVYGHQKRYPPKDCDDTKLEVPFAPDNFDRIKQVINNLTPKGTTPIGFSLEACGNDFPAVPKGRNIVILITDGLEECEADPCAISQALQKKGIIIKPFVIGIGMKTDYNKAFECVGQFYDATNERSFKSIMNIVISQALNNTTAQVNLLDEGGKPTETNVNMTFYDRQSGKVKYNFVHTINNRGNPDTLRLDALLTYKIVVHTIPPVYKDSVKILSGKHTIIPIDAPQGDLLLKFDAISEYKHLNAIVRKSNDLHTLNIQDFNATEKYIVGKYDLEVLCLPRLHVKDVEISQSKTTTVKIPQPGLVTFISNSTGYGSLYIEETNKLTWFYNLDRAVTKQTLVLQPGNYKAVFRIKNARETLYTIERSFTVTSGVSQIVNLINN